MFLRKCSFVLPKPKPKTEEHNLTYSAVINSKRETNPLGCVKCFSLCRSSYACLFVNNNNAHTQDNQGEQTRMRKTYEND